MKDLVAGSGLVFEDRGEHDAEGHPGSLAPVRCRAVTGRLDGKVALITGAGSGMGREACAVFASEGARVAAVDIDPELLEGTETAVRAIDG